MRVLRSTLRLCRHISSGVTETRFLHARVTVAYWSENRLKSASNGTTLYYDPLGRMSEYDTTVSTRFINDGVEMAAEIDNPAGAILRRYVRADGIDQPLVWYEGSGTATRRFLHADERGSIIAVSDASGNRYASFRKSKRFNDFLEY